MYLKLVGLRLFTFQNIIKHALEKSQFEPILIEARKQQDVVKSSRFVLD
ncbi:hypothetical protein GPAL_3193 [Glaciecola pallidula DSM 14239 = ACAM 615]|jgi:hypothetical protein|uniref:Uncharacterized protein n=1 Tax=Brumicola pallidula DSM 14239 = ACAM 615 TaxID=1121922 RepID=K6YBC6_9ALTE|nr:hypothetical protein GPAL_3193 [Glaciecola pallidula DSM 14239 = ACAM 615]